MNNEHSAINEGIRKEVLIVHDDLNVCGGSERLAATTIETLAEIGFNVDLATFTMPDQAAEVVWNRFRWYSKDTPYKSLLRSERRFLQKQL